jgi:hypothetical protein
VSRTGKTRERPPRDPRTQRAGVVARRLRLLVLALAWCGSGAGCGGNAPRDAIDRDVFVEAWVDLRIAAMTAPGNELPEPERARILAEHGVGEEDLLTFAEVHGADIAYMKSVWDDVELRLEERGYGAGTPVPGPGADSAG